MACFSLLEQCIEFLTCGPILALEDRQVVQLHTAMTGAFGAVMYYLQMAQFDAAWVREVCLCKSPDTQDLRPLPPTRRAETGLPLLQAIRMGR